MPNLPMPPGVQMNIQQQHTPPPPPHAHTMLRSTLLDRSTPSPASLADPHHSLHGLAPPRSVLAAGAADNNDNASPPGAFSSLLTGGRNGGGPGAGLSPAVSFSAITYSTSSVPISSAMYRSTAPLSLGAGGFSSAAAAGPSDMSHRTPVSVSIQTITDPVHGVLLTHERRILDPALLTAQPHELDPFRLSMGMPHAMAHPHLTHNHSLPPAPPPLLPHAAHQHHMVSVAAGTGPGAGIAAHHRVERHQPGGGLAPVRSSPHLLGAGAGPGPGPASLSLYSLAGSTSGTSRALSPPADSRAPIAENWCSTHVRQHSLIWIITSPALQIQYVHVNSSVRCA